jgi:hypothetical protein
MANKITETAQLECDKGSSPTKLAVTRQDFSTFDDKLIATEEDAKPNENILPFGSCKAKNNMPCSPATQKWDKTSEKDTINDLKIVLETSECLCSTGGKITVLDKGHEGKIEAE